MALVTMTRLALAAERAATAPALVPKAEAVARPAAGTADESVSSALDQIVAYVPSEVIGIYIAGVGILGPESARGKWGLLLFAAALIPLFIWLSERIERRANPTAGKAVSRLGRVWLLATAAFLAWSAALPQTPFLEFSAKATQIGSFVAVVLAALMPKVSSALDLTPAA